MVNRAWLRKPLHCLSIERLNLNEKPCLRTAVYATRSWSLDNWPEVSSVVKQHIWRQREWRSHNTRIEIWRLNLFEGAPLEQWKQRLPFCCILAKMRSHYEHDSMISGVTPAPFVDVDFRPLLSRRNCLTANASILKYWKWNSFWDVFWKHLVENRKRDIRLKSSENYIAITRKSREHFTGFTCGSWKTQQESFL